MILQDCDRLYSLLSQCDRLHPWFCDGLIREKYLITQHSARGSTAHIPVSGVGGTHCLAPVCVSILAPVNFVLKKTSCFNCAYRGRGKKTKENSRAARETESQQGHTGRVLILSNSNASTYHGSNRERGIHACVCVCVQPVVKTLIEYCAVLFTLLLVCTSQ